MSRRKKNPYRWYVFSLWLIGTAAAVYGAYSYEWATTPHTPQEIEWYRERFGNLEPEFSYTRVGIYSAFASLVIYMVIQFVVKFFQRRAAKGVELDGPTT